MAVAFDFTLTSDGQVMDTSKGKLPFEYLHGYRQILPGLENAMLGREAGDTFSIDIPPEEGYGLRDESRRVALPRDEFEDDELVIGQQLTIMGPTGMRAALLLSFDDENVVFDDNHILAGKTLHFEVEILGVRESNSSERMCGHVHAPIPHGKSA
jgi:FKBP-type peptidyl-prolyl cis-trans isomerase SlyD